jgi:hypothetical protein
VLTGFSLSGRLDFGRTELTVTAKPPPPALWTKQGLWLPGTTTRRRP